MNPIQDEGIRAMDQDEHNGIAHAKRIIIRAQDPVSGDWVNISAVDNGDGTFSLKDQTKGFGVERFDDIEFTDPDGNGNYQTITYSLASTPVQVLTLAFDGNSNVTSIVKT